MSKKNNSVLDKLIPLGTIQRRQRQKKEIEEMKIEGLNAIQALHDLNLDPDSYELKENEERSALEISEKKKLEPLIKVILINWINTELSEKRIIAKDLQEDLYDGHILKLLVEKLSNVSLGSEKVALGEISQKQNLKTVLDFLNTTMDVHPTLAKWKVENIYEKDIIAILHLLVAIVKFYNVNIKLPDNITVKVIIIQKKKKLEKITVTEQITGNFTDEQNARKDRDAFDTLFDHAPEKLSLVENSLLTFINKHLEHMDVKVTDLKTELSDGIYLIYLMGLLEGYFVALYAYNQNPKTYEEKLQNCKYAFKLIDDAGVPTPNCTPEELASGDLKATLRILYLLFSNFKDREYNMDN